MNLSTLGGASKDKQEQNLLHCPFSKRWIMHKDSAKWGFVSPGLTILVTGG